MRYRQSPERIRGFTLIELLVVVGIIAILATLLLPCLLRAKMQAQGVKCLSNLQQFSYAWNMYADENSEVIPPNNGSGDHTDPASENETWVTGWLIQGKQTGFFTDWPDNTNTLLLKQSLIAPQLGRSVGVWRCPSDQSVGYIGNTPHPRVRSYSMNMYMNSDPLHGGDKIDPFEYFGKRTELRHPSPSQTFVFIDNREDSIEDSVFTVDMHNFPCMIGDLPRSAHNGKGTLSYADGHAELHKWRDPRTNPPLVSDGYAMVLYDPRVVNVDCLWIRERTTGRK
jgi:prepilin-type N-terminal cleavage/methylation domain-containing protein/prepilin-type processing-associated H-X9-DG protein